jgi:hypothetical protein
VPHHPDQDGRLSLPPNLVGRQQALDLLRLAGAGMAGVESVPSSCPGAARSAARTAG